MGLDMYLTGRRYLSKHFNPGDEAVKNSIKDQFPELANMRGRWDDDSPVKEVSIDVGYWRKANAIHDWFVRECQGGVDECQQTYVGREKLLQLKAVCEAVLTNRRDAPKLLPTASGFFFGSTDYDDWYFSDLEDTVKIIDDALSLPDHWEFEYRSSW